MAPVVFLLSLRSSLQWDLFQASCAFSYPTSAHAVESAHQSLKLTVHKWGKGGTYRGGSGRKGI